MLIRLAALPLAQLALLLAVVTTPTQALPAKLSAADASPEEVLHEIAMLDVRMSPKGRERIEQAVGHEAERQLRLGGEKGLHIGVAKLETPSGVWRDKNTRNLIRLSDGKIIRGPNAVPGEAVDFPVSPEQSALNKAMADIAQSPRFVRKLFDGLRQGEPKALDPLLMQTAMMSTGLFAGAIRWMPFVEHRLHTGYWEISIDEIYVQERPLGISTAAGLVDSSSNRLAFSTKIAKIIYSHIPGSEFIQTASESSTVHSYSIPCGSNVSFSIVVAGKHNFMYPGEFRITRLASGKDHCLGAAYGLDLLSERPGPVNIEESFL